MPEVIRSTTVVVRSTLTIAADEVVTARFTEMGYLAAFELSPPAHDVFARGPDFINFGRINAEDVRANGSGAHVVSVHTGSVSWSGVVVENHGEMHASSASSDAHVFSASSWSPSVVNTGVMTAQAALDAIGVMSWTHDIPEIPFFVDNSGSMSVEGLRAWGVRVVSGQITNSGLIRAEGDESSYGVYLARGSLANSGQIIAVGGSADQPGVGVAFGHMGLNGIGHNTLVNEAAGSITGTFAVAEVVDAASTTTLVNYGALNGDVDLRFGEDAFRNAGATNGRAWMGGGDDHYDGRGGAISGIVDGGDGDDVLTGGASVERLVAGAGEDYLDGGEGNDILTGGAGADVFLLGAGADTLTDFDPSIDRLALNGGRQFTGMTIAAGASALTHAGGVLTVEGIANLTLDQWNALLVDSAAGTIGDDDLIGGAGVDHLFGGHGDDELVGGQGDDVLMGGAGVDTASFAGGPRVRVELGAAPAQTGQGLDRLVDIENLRGSAFDDELIGDARANSLWGGDGNDVLDGGDGDDILEGGFGDDVISGGSGFDVVDYRAATERVVVNLGLARQNTVFGSDVVAWVEGVLGSAFNDYLAGTWLGDLLVGLDGDDELWGVGGDDNLEGGAGADVLHGGAGNDNLWGGDGDDQLYSDTGGDSLMKGGDGDDLLVGGEGSEELYGEAGDDILIGGGWWDLLYGGDGVDLVTYRTNPMGVEVDMRVQGDWMGQNAYSEFSGVDVFLGIENAEGSQYNDVIMGADGTAANVLSGLGGNDRLIGLGGDDTLEGGLGEDELYGGAGDDVLYDGAEATNRDFLFGGAGHDTYHVTSSLAGPLDLVFEGGDNPDLTAGSGDIDAIYSAGSFFWDYYGVGERLFIATDAGSQLVGGTNSQEIYGGAGSDQIIAYGGSNRVDAGAGADAISFGLYGLSESFDGANTLVMKAGSGMDYVYEFESGVDKIDLTTFNFGITGAQVLAQAVNVDNAGTANDYCYFYLTNAGGVDNFVVLMGLLSNQLSAGDFIT